MVKRASTDAGPHTNNATYQDFLFNRLTEQQSLLCFLCFLYARQAAQFFVFSDPEYFSLLYHTSFATVDNIFLVCYLLGGRSRLLYIAIKA